MANKKELETVNQITETAPAKLGNFSNIEEMVKWADTIIESGLLPDSISEPEQVITIVQHGKELGLTPHIALNNLHVIAGRPVISSSMLGALLKRRGVEWIIKEDFVDIGDENNRTTYTFFWKSPNTGRIMETDFSITWRQMEIAGYTTKQNWEKYPKEMMRARCIAYAVRAIFPEVLMGMYTDMEFNDVAEEMGGDEQQVGLTEEGDITIIQAEQ